MLIAVLIKIATKLNLYINDIHAFKITDNSSV
jgi:hypothetical protein